jgi:2-oxoglutarate dehydrogenase E1 component
MNIWRDFSGPNVGYILELYDRYQQNPNSIDTATKVFFEQWGPPPDGLGLSPTIGQIDKIMGAINLAQAIREYGHLAAQLDPLGSEPSGAPSLELATHGLTGEDLRQLSASLIGGPIAQRAGNAWEAIQTLRQVYARKTGYDYDHLRLPTERKWLRDAAESERFCFPKDPVDPKALLKRLTQVEVFEQ